MIEIIVKNAEFVRSFPSVQSMEGSPTTQVAFLGRSNVGKSSLINFLAAKQGLAKVSNTPGRTQLINLFQVTLLRKENGNRQEKQVPWVDLPGFGYAKLSKAVQEDPSQMLKDFWNDTFSRRFVLHLFDIRREPNQEDLVLSQHLRRASAGYFLVLTKSDQLIQSKRKAAIQRLAERFSLPAAQVLPVSMKEKFGKEAILSLIWEACAK